MAWDMHPKGSSVVVDLNTELGRALSEELAKKGLDSTNTILRVVENKMVEEPREELATPYRTPRIVLALPDNSTIETQPVALSRVS